MTAPRWITNLRLRYKLFLTYSVVLLLTVGIGTIVLDTYLRRAMTEHIETELKKSTELVINMVRTAAAVSIKNHLRAVAEDNREIVSHYYQEYLSGRLSEREAKEAARSILLSQKVGKTGYLFVWDVTRAPESITMAVHPKIEGQEIASIDFVQAGAKLRNGYMEYRWKNPGEEHERDKAMYLATFEPWNWIIAASSYRDEFLKLINVDDFRANILSVTLQQRGYFYILDSAGNLIVHPKFGGNVYDLTDESGRHFVREICERKRGTLFYTWKNPDESAYHPKLSQFDYLPEYDWIVVASSYEEEFNAPLYSARSIVLVTSGITVLLLLLCSFVLGSCLSRPMQQLVDAFEHDTTDLTTRLPLKSSDEIGRLTLGFNRFMDNLERESIERKAAEEALQESETRFRALSQEFHVLLDTIPDAIALYSPDLKIVWANRCAAELAGKDIALIQGGLCYEVWHNRHRPCDVCPVQATLQSGEPASAVVTRFEERTFETRSAPVRDANGLLTGVVEISRDVTDQRRLEMQLIQAQKLEAIGTLSGGVAHDFNNILAAIIGYTEMSLDDLPASSPVKENLGQVLKAGLRAKDLVKQILVFSRKQDESERVPTRLAPLIEESLKFVRASLPSTIEVRSNVSAEDVAAQADPTQIQQVLINLCTNAAHAMENRPGVLQVGLDSVVLDGVTSISYGIPPGEYARLSVADTGHGMDQTTLARIFDPYFTTKAIGKGSGLGLAVVHGIVKQHGGTIRVESSVDQGATFQVLLPKIEAGPLNAGLVTCQADSGHERILVVDDEETLVAWACKSLEHLGYKVSGTTSSAEALDWLRDGPECYDLLITDYTMPHLTGEDVAREAKRIRPDLPIVLVSGFSEHMTREKAKEMDVSEFIMKPLLTKDLANVVRSALRPPCPTNGSPQLANKGCL